MQEVYTNVTKVLVDSRSNSNLLYMPLDRLMQAAGAPTPTAPTAPPAAAPTDSAATGTVDIRSRDNQRTRDRDGR
jgi:modulator of FtsH protease HflK